MYLECTWMYYLFLLDLPCPKKFPTFRLRHTQKKKQTSQANSVCLFSAGSWACWTNHSRQLSAASHPEISGNYLIARPVALAFSRLHVVWTTIGFLPRWTVEASNQQLRRFRVWPPHLIRCQRLAASGRRKMVIHGEIATGTGEKVKSWQLFNKRNDSSFTNYILI